MKVNFRPKTPLGKWSFGLILIMPILFFVGSLLASSLYNSETAGNTLMEDLAARPALALAMLMGMASGISAFICGLLSVIRQKERALFVYAAVIIGALLISFLLGEFIFPH